MRTAKEMNQYQIDNNFDFDKSKKAVQAFTTIEYSISNDENILTCFTALFGDWNSLYAFVITDKRILRACKDKSGKNFHAIDLALWSGIEVKNKFLTKEIHIEAFSESFHFSVSSTSNHQLLTKKLKAILSQKPVQKTEHHIVAGTSYRQDAIKSLGKDNPFYFDSKRELVEFGFIEEELYQYEFSDLSLKLVPDPGNKRDPNAIKVLVDNVHIGFIKKESTNRIRFLFNNNYVKSFKVEIKGGKYKYISSEYDHDKDKEVYSMETGSSDFFAIIHITTVEKPK